MICTASVTYLSFLTSPARSKVLWSCSTSYMSYNFRLRLIHPLSARIIILNDGHRHSRKKCARFPGAYSDLYFRLPHLPME